MFARKRSPEPLSAEPSRKSQRWEPRESSVASRAPWSYENASRRTNFANDDPRPARSDFERRPPPISDARINPFARSPPRRQEEELEPPGTESTTLQYTLTPRVSFLTWKDRVYRELEELNCLFTVEPTLRRKANMTLDDELTYRNLAKAVICMRLDNAHLALVSNLDDPLKVMKVLSDIREPELRHLEKRAMQRLNSTVYHSTVPVRDFLRTFENQLRELEKYSGERMSDSTMKQQLLSAIVGDFPDIMVGSKLSSGEIRYEDLKKLLIEAVERRTAIQNAELKMRQAARTNVSTSAAASVASQKVMEKQPVAQKIQAPAPGRVDERRVVNTNTAVSQGLESRIGTSKAVGVNDRRPIISNAGSRNSVVTEQYPTGSNATNTVSKEQHPIADQRPAIKDTAGNQVVGKKAEENERHSANIAHQSSVANTQRPTISSPALVKGSHAAQDSEGSAKCVVDERPFARDVKANERRSAVSSDKDERPLPVGDAKANERPPMSVADEQNPAARVARPSEQRPGATNGASKNTDKEDSRPVGPSTYGVQRTPVSTPQTKVDEQRAATKTSDSNQRSLATSDAAGKNADAVEQGAAAKTVASNDTSAVGTNSALYERRVPKPSPKDELEEQLELDRKIQEQIEGNSRLAAKEVSCTKCGAYGHVVSNCKRRDNHRKCYSCLQFVDDHVASSCPHWNECAVMPRKPSKFSVESKPTSMKPASFGQSRFVVDNRPVVKPPETMNAEIDEEEDEDDLPLVSGMRQVLHIRRKMTTKKLKTGRVARTDLIFTDSDFYMDVEYREMFIEEDEKEPGDIVLESIKVMSTN